MKIILAFIAGAVVATAVLLRAIGSFTNHMWKD